MIRPLTLAALLTLAAGPAAAQQAPTVRLRCEPAAIPVPALKYYLLPQLRDRQRGNALLLYYRAFSPEWQKHRSTAGFLEKVADANARPLRDLKRAEVDTLVGGFYAGILREVDRGARRSYCDWELTQRLREDGIGLNLPDVQAFRETATLLKLRARQELLAGRFDQAARTIQTGLAVARHVAEGPTLIHSLVAAAVASTILSVVDDWVERPGAPNLYWALTDLPRPLLSIRAGIEGERVTMDWLFPGYREALDDPGASPPAGSRWSIVPLLAGLDNLEGPNRTLGPLLAALKTYPRAKRFLRRQGFSAAAVEAMPAVQAVFLYEVHRYDVAYDDLRKWVSLPYAEAAPQVRKAIERERERSKREALPFLSGMLLPAVNRVLAAPARVERKVAALRCVEALRLHAAAHDGKLPAGLDVITEVPVPLDPFTGKPFEYHLQENKATLTGPPPAGEKADANNSLLYELAVRAAAKDKETRRQGGRSRSLVSRPLPMASPANLLVSLSPCLLVWTAGEPKFDAAERARALAPLIEDETFALVRVDFTRAELDALAEALLPLVPAGGAELAGLAGRVKDFRKAFTEAGGSALVVSLSTEDLPGISFVHVPLADKADAAALTGLLKKHLPDRAVVEKRGAALVGGSRAALARLARAKPSNREELLPAVRVAGNTALQVFLLPTADQRRVVGEVVTLPGGGASVLTRGVRWAAFSAVGGPKPRAELTVQSADAAAARKLAGLVETTIDRVGKMKFLGEDRPLKELLPREFARAAALRPKVAGSRVTLQVSEADVAGRALAALADAVAARTLGVERSTSQLRRVVSALYGYNDANGALPPHAIYSRDGKPLLSWRVALLPHLGLKELYKEFKLDEPWDSPHNKKLIARMPGVFRSPKIKDPRHGLTTYVVPVHKEFVFVGTKEGLRLPRDIPDGTSNTVLVLDVGDEAGVIWTKPEDRVVDKKDPWKGLLGHFPGFVLAGMADGTVRRVPKSAKASTVWALFTRAGGEVVPDLSK
jgi:hypothetical protein